jgi:hypothetical protein
LGIEAGEKLRLKDHEMGWGQAKELKGMGKSVLAAARTGVSA